MKTWHGCFYFATFLVSSNYLNPKPTLINSTRWLTDWHWLVFYENKDSKNKPIHWLGFSRTYVSNFTKVRDTNTRKSCDDYFRGSGDYLLQLILIPGQFTRALKVQMLTKLTRTLSPFRERVNNNVSNKKNLR